MSGRYFLDTNIFVYSFDAGAPVKAGKAMDLIRRALSTGRGIVSYQVVQEFLNVALRRFAHPMTALEAEEYFNKVLRPLLAVHSSPDLYSAALDLIGRASLSWYDSLIIAAAQEGRCDVLYSEDFQHGRKLGSVEVRNPFL
jgi:predicted nucleic acid-binding protein